MALQKIKLDLPENGFELDSGEFLAEIEVAFETYGKLSANKDNAIFICHALTGDAHAASIQGETNSSPQVETNSSPQGETNSSFQGKTQNPSQGEMKDSPGWWDAMIGPGKGIDSDHYFVICANILGGCRGTTGPGSMNPQTNEPYGSSFPLITVGDIVKVHALLVKYLDVDTLAAVIGGSFGGMQVLEWTIRFPEMVQRAICIASAASLSSQALAFDIVGRDAITKDPEWVNGDYYKTKQVPSSGLSLARKIGHITYLSPGMMEKKFGRERKIKEHQDVENSYSKVQKFCSNFQVESYLDYQANKFINRFDANSYLYITRAMDEYDLQEKFGSLTDAFSHVKAKFLIVSLNKDWLFDPEQSMEIAKSLLSAGKEVSYCNLEAPHGHDAFLVDIQHLSEVIRAFLPWINEEDNSRCKCSIVESDGWERDEYKIITSLIDPKSKVLDLGCGNGNLLSKLSNEIGIRGIGVDIDIEQVKTVINSGHDIFQGDIDQGLSMIPDNSYDYAILSETLQVVRKPKFVLKEMLRVAKEGFISFPNFGNYAHRIYLAVHGRMPIDDSLPYEWYNTPNIHLFTLKDFIRLCREENIKILNVYPLASSFLGNMLIKGGFENIGAQQILLRIIKKD